MLTDPFIKAQGKPSNKKIKSLYLKLWLIIKVFIENPICMKKNAMNTIVKHHGSSMLKYVKTYPIRDEKMAMNMAYLLANLWIK